MLRRLLLTLLASVLLASVAIPVQVDAQGAAPAAPAAQGQGVNPRDAQRAAHRPGVSSMPPEMLNAPYSGPGATQLPPNIRTREDIENPANRAALQAAAAASRPQLEAAKRQTERIARGDRTPPTREENQAIYGNPNGPPPRGVPNAPPPRAETDNPVAEAAYGLLSFIRALPDSRILPSAPESTTEASPDAQAFGTCNNYAWLWDSYDYQWGAQFFYAEGLQICGVVSPSDIKSMHMGTALFKCSWYFSWFNGCLSPQHYDELLPVDSQGAGSNVQWGRLKTYYPWVSGAYYLKIYTYVEYWQGGWTNNQADSAGFVTFNCPGYGCS